MISLIIPVYLNESSISALLREVADLQVKLGEALEAVFVVDGSPDGSYSLLKSALQSQTFRSRLVSLSRNFGSFAAIRAGLALGQGDLFAVMAADLQEPPQAIVEMCRPLRAGLADVTVGVRRSRDDPVLTRLSSQVFWNMYRRWIVAEIPPGGVDIFACNKQVRDILISLTERHSSLVAQLFWVGFRRLEIPYDRRKRKHGKSAWTIKKKLSYLSDSIFAFTDLPIKMLIRGGGAVAAVAAMLGLVVMIGRLTGHIEIPGYTMIILLMVFIGASNILALGIVGSYAWRAYENTQLRPVAIPMRIEEF